MAAELTLVLNENRSISEAADPTFAVPWTADGHLDAHLSPNAPTVANGAQAQAGMTVTGSDSAFSVAGTSLAAGNAAGIIATITFKVPFAATPRVAVEETNTQSKTSHLYVSAKSATQIVISCNVAYAAAAPIAFDCIVVG